MFFLPDSALKARWLTPHEREIAHSRPQKNINSFKSTHWKRYQAVEALTDPKTWLLFFYTAFTSLPNGGVTNVSLPFPLSMVCRLNLPATVYVGNHKGSWSRSVPHAPPRYAPRRLPSILHSHGRFAGNQTPKVTLHYHCLSPLHRDPWVVSCRLPTSLPQWRSAWRRVHICCLCVRLPAQPQHHCKFSRRFHEEDSSQCCYLPSVLCWQYLRASGLFRPRSTTLSHRV